MYFELCSPVDSNRSGHVSRWADSCWRSHFPKPVGLVSDLLYLELSTSPKVSIQVPQMVLVRAQIPLCFAVDNQGWCYKNTLSLESWGVLLVNYSLSSRFGSIFKVKETILTIALFIFTLTSSQGSRRDSSEKAFYLRTQQSSYVEPHVTKLIRMN